MPIFEYICGRCGEKFEKLVLNKDLAIACPKCKNRKVEKCFSSFATAGTSKGKGSSQACGSCHTKNCSHC